MQGLSCIILMVTARKTQDTLTLHQTKNGKKLQSQRL